MAVLGSAPGAGDEITAIPVNRRWDVLQAPAKNASYEDFRPIIRQAGELLGDWKLNVAGLTLTGPQLVRIADTAPEEPFLRHLRESLRRPFDLVDLALFLDDVLLAGDQGLRGKLVWVPSGRARKAGITIHPDDVFRNRPRLYGTDSHLNIDKPKRPAELPPAKDGDLLGPNWTARFRNPSGPDAMLAALDKENASGTYGERIRSLRDQIRQQGGEFYIYSTTRNRARGYLMWGAFHLSRRTTEGQVRQALQLLEARNGEWGLNIPILWSHPDGWQATVSAAREMADAYDVVYATENGAKNSNHYGGRAVDFVAFGLPRKLTLVAPSGDKETFDLSDPEETRDINLTPRIISWIEKHFQVRKLRGDYPHWDDRAPRK